MPNIKRLEAGGIFGIKVGKYGLFNFTLKTCSITYTADVIRRQAPCRQGINE
jgi:hypothetical protein